MEPGIIPRAPTFSGKNMTLRNGTWAWPRASCFKPSTITSMHSCMGRSLRTSCEFNILILFKVLRGYDTAGGESKGESWESRERGRSRERGIENLNQNRFAGKVKIRGLVNEAFRFPPFPDFPFPPLPKTFPRNFSLTYCVLALDFRI